MYRKIVHLFLIVLLFCSGCSKTDASSRKPELKEGVYYNANFRQLGSIVFYQDGSGVGRQRTSDLPIKWMISKEGYLIVSSTSGVINSSCFIIDGDYMLPVLGYDYTGPEIDERSTFNAEFVSRRSGESLSFFEDGRVRLNKGNNEHKDGTYTRSGEILTVNYDSSSWLNQFLLHDGHLYEQFLVKEE